MVSASRRLRLAETMWRAVTAALLLLVSADADALRHISLKDMDNHKCKVMCQRFGMKALGAQFAEIKHPTECCQKCDEVYPKAAALLQVDAEPKASAQPMASPPKGGAQGGSAPPA